MSHIDIALNNISRDLLKKKKITITSDCDSCETIRFTFEFFFCVTDNLRTTFCIYRSKPGHPVQYLSTNLCLVTRRRYFVNIVVFQRFESIIVYVGSRGCLIYFLRNMFGYRRIVFIHVISYCIVSVAIRLCSTLFYERLKRLAQRENAARFECLTMILATLVKPKTIETFDHVIRLVANNAKRRRATLRRSIWSM